MMRSGLMRDLPYYANMRDGELMRIRRARSYTGRLAFVLAFMALGMGLFVWVMA